MVAYHLLIDAALTLSIQKKERILKASRARDYDELRALAISSHGFISDESRREACEYLV